MHIITTTLLVPKKKSEHCSLLETVVFKVVNQDACDCTDTKPVRSEQEERWEDYYKCDYG